MKGMITLLGAALLLGSCGDSGSGVPRTAAGVCDELCGWDDACYAQLGVTVPEMCVESCEQQIDLVGLDCLRAILVAFDCIGTCNFDEVTESQIQACQDEALAIGSACE